MFFISPAFAETATSAADAVAGTEAAGPGFLVTMAPLILVFFVFYVLVIRPQNKRMMEHRKTINDMQKGDRVVTGGGIIATVKKVVNDSEVVLDLGGTEVTALRQTIMMMYNPGASTNTAEKK